MSKFFRTARFILAVMLASSAMTAHANLVRIDFVGINSSPGAINVWGTPVPDLTGYLIFEDSVAGAVFSSTATNYSNAVREMSFSIGAGPDAQMSGFRTAAGGFGGNLGQAQVQNAAGSDRLSFNNLVFGTSNLSGPLPTVSNSTNTGTRTITGATLTVGIAGPANTISDQLLDGIDPLDFFVGFSTPGASPIRNVQLSLNYTTSGTTTGFNQAVSYNYNLYPVSVSEVPLPAAAWMFASGLISLGGLARRRRREVALAA